MSSTLASFANSADYSVDTLKKALAANGLPQYGTKEQMLNRLLTPGGATAKSAPKKKKATSTATSAVTAASGEMKQFMASERPRLVAMGMTDTASQDIELKRRWEMLAKAKKSTSTGGNAAAGNEIRLPTCLTKDELAVANLKLVNCDTTSGTPVFVYQTLGTGGATPAPAPKVGAKRKAEDEEGEDCEEDDDEDLEWACEVMVGRLMKKATKDTLSLLCGEFGVATTGTKKALAEALAEQCHYETDEEEE